MGWWLLKIIAISIFIIIVMHYLYEYIKNTYSTNIKKDIIGFQTKKYKEIMEEILQKEGKIDAPSSLQDDFLNENDKQTIENDLAELVSSYN
jgi:hypothetical protein